MNTKNKIRFLQKYLLANYIQLCSIHPENIAGFRISKKKRKGSFVRQIAIIWQVRTKQNPEELLDSQQIPKNIEILFPDGVSRKVPTDVEQTGGFQFHAGIGGKVTSNYSPANKFGSAGLFVTDDGNRTLMMTNYHVVAENFMDQNLFYYRRPPSMHELDVSLEISGHGVVMGSFLEGLFSEKVDVAFVELEFRPQSANQLPSGISIQNKIKDQPLPETYRDRPVILYTYYHPEGVASSVNDVSTVINIGHQDLKLINVIQLYPRVTNGGDSGSIVLTNSYGALGIIVGGDSKYSYAIPFYNLDNFKYFSII